MRWNYFNVMDRKEVDSKTVFRSVAKKYRFLNSFDHAAAKRKKIGHFLGFKAEHYLMLEGGK
jgi:ubiquinone/menaquinone biosynthesis C-methylase UbiE